MHNNTRALFVCERECYAHILHTLFSLWAHVPQIHRTSTCAQQCLDFMNPSTQNLTPQFHRTSIRAQQCLDFLNPSTQNLTPIDRSSIS
eukprot:scaffold167494_cov23-Tisochrysis_lutea.AAC.1